MGVETFSLSTKSLDLKQQMQVKRDAAAERQLRLIWDLPALFAVSPGGS